MKSILYKICKNNPDIIVDYQRLHIPRTQNNFLIPFFDAKDSINLILSLIHNNHRLRNYLS
jgi:hypothetical protein